MTSSITLACMNQECGKPVDVRYWVEGRDIPASHSYPGERAELVIDDAECAVCGRPIRRDYSDTDIERAIRDAQAWAA